MISKVFQKEELVPGVNYYIKSITVSAQNVIIVFQILT